MLKIVSLFPQRFILFGGMYVCVHDCVCMRVCVHGCACVCVFMSVDALRDGGVGFPGPIVTGGYEPPSLGAGNKTGSHCKGSTSS